MKQQNNDTLIMTADEINMKFKSFKFVSKKKFVLIIGVVLSAIIVFGIFLFSLRIGLGENKNLLSISLLPTAETALKMESINIPSGIVKANPFLPYRNIDDKDGLSTDVPKFDLVAPPEAVIEGSDAARVMDTIVSGILYDKFSPSAILNIEGTDYLVKKGDIVNNYKIINITKDNVTVKLGKNTFTAGIGEILTEGDLITNDVSNLNKKFGGEK